MKIQIALRSIKSKFQFKKLLGPHSIFELSFGIKTNDIRGITSESREKVLERHYLEIKKSKNNEKTNKTLHLKKS